MILLHGSQTSKIDPYDPRFLALVQASQKIAEKDASSWGPAAQEEASIRLNWVDSPQTSRALLPELDALAARYRAFSRVVLCGMGGSSLAPEVIAASFEKDLFVLDSTDPDYIAHALNGDLSKTVVVVSSKSGSTVETASQRALFEWQFTNAGLNPTDHMVIVTDPGSPLDKDARTRGFAVVNADPNVGGRFSALTAFGLVPAALLGIDVSVLLDAASDVLPSFQGNQSPAVAAAFMLAYQSGQYLAFSDTDSGMPGLSDWIEQLIAESTGKEKVGRLPIVLESQSSPIGGEGMRISFSGKSDLVIEGDLGSQFIFWEWVTALLGFALEIDPFNQPNVTEAKEQTASLLTAWAGKLPKFTPNFVDGAVEIFADASTVQDALTKVIDAVSPDGYIAVMAYLDRKGDEELAQLRRILAEKSSRPVTFGWGPRFLHSTGQFHKGGQQNGVFLQITGEPSLDIEIPGKEFTFKTLIAAQALGDGQALSSRGLTVVRLHLRDRDNGIAEILSAARAII
ncbi:MAG TPA: glucose-6-phosphate isomerase [Candidatus Nanopelagicaceae bacterium]|jgi:glucose-6-phosphate isomerase